MRKPKSSIPALIIAFLCIAVYTAALAAGAYRFYDNVTVRRVIAEREFYDLADLASAAGVMGFMDTPFREAVQDGLEKSRTLEGLIISGPSEEYAFERERGAIIHWEGDSPRFVKRFGVSSTSAVPLRINGFRNVTISAGFSSIDYDYSITVLKHSLVVILAALAVAFFTFIVESALAREPLPAGGRRRGNRRAAGYDEEEFDSGFDESVPEPAGRGAGNLKKTAASTAGSYEAPAASGFPEDSEGAYGDFDGPEVDFPSGEDFAPPEDEVPSGEEGGVRLPQGLYAPGSNIGWEAYTKDRLESELHRCASFEQDLTVIIAAFSGKDKLSGEQYGQFAGMAVSFFNLRDLIFEMGDRGITVILPNTDVEQGFARAEDFYNYLIPAFRGLPDFRIGMSSRSGRLVDSGRLYFEAEESLNKALRDPVSPVIAFKSDPEKYRAFLRSREK
jgi:hypothetical protein